MKKIISPNSIFATANYIKNKLEELKSAKNILIEDINSIKNIYQGKDADLIINKYLENLKVIDIIIYNYNNLREYFLEISSDYSTNLNKTKNLMNQINNSFSNKKDDLNNIINEKIKI